MDGLSSEAVSRAMAIAMHSAATEPGVVAISAGNYGGKLGPFHFRLMDLIDRNGGD